MSARTFGLSEPSSAAVWAARHTYGQLTMKPPLEPWKSDRVASSSALDSDGPPTPLEAMPRMMEAARWPAGEAMPSLMASRAAPGFWMMCPPADSISALMSTV
jgi:hypothetical protein